MNPLLLALGVVLVGCAVSLLLTEEKSWALGVLKGVGIQAVIGLMVSIAHLGISSAPGEPPTLGDRVWRSVEGVPYHTGGWTAMKTYQNLVPSNSPRAGLEAYLLVVGVQVLLVGLVAGWRLMRDDSSFDFVLVLLWVLLFANAVVSAMWPVWWASA